MVRASQGTRKYNMVLHRDIYWVGRQWAVTGHGMQAIDQKRQGKFDIEASLLWDDGVLASRRAEPWLNGDDFAKGLALARARYPEPPRTGASPPDGVSRVGDRDLIEPSKPPLQKFQMRFDDWPAKFVRPWRIRIGRNRRRG
jgi:hypothetical protein